jgi:hypothetical protein
MPLDPTEKTANAVLQRLFSRIGSRGAAYFPLCKLKGLCYTQPGAKHWFALFLGSSVVEQPAVNRLVAGSNPARGAKHLNHLCETAQLDRRGDTLATRKLGAGPPQHLLPEIISRASILAGMRNLFDCAASHALWCRRDHADNDDDRNGNGNFRTSQRQHFPGTRP